VAVTVEPGARAKSATRVSRSLASHFYTVHEHKSMNEDGETDCLEIQQNLLLHPVLLEIYLNFGNDIVNDRPVYLRLHDRGREDCISLEVLCIPTVPTTILFDLRAGRDKAMSASCSITSHKVLRRHLEYSIRHHIHRHTSCQRAPAPPCFAGSYQVSTSFLA